MKRYSGRGLDGVTYGRRGDELKRRTRVVRIFPDSGSCLRRVAALSMETSEQWQARCYLDMAVERAATEAARSAA